MLDNLQDVLHLRLSTIFFLITFTFIIYYYLPHIASVTMYSRKWSDCYDNLDEMSSIIGKKEDTIEIWRNKKNRTAEKITEVNEQLYQNTSNEEVKKLYETNLVIIKLNKKKLITTSYMDRKDFIEREIYKIK